jgi:tol-pal system protein YbgF
MEADIVKLKSEFASQRKDLNDEMARGEREREKFRTEQDAAIKRIDDKVQEVSSTMEGLNKSARKTGADLGVELEAAQKEIARLRGVIEESQAKAGSLEQSFTAYREEMQARLLASENRLAELEAGRKPGDAKKPTERPATKEAFLAFAQKKLEAGEYAEARALFWEYQEKWKNDAQTATAQFGIGESYYAEKKYREAGVEFQKVRDQFPKSDKAPDALLKVGLSFAELNLKDEAKLFLEELLRTYPKASAAKTAKEKLAELARKK